MYNCGGRWDEVVYNSVVVGDSGKLAHNKEQVGMRRIPSCELVISFKFNREISHVDRRVHTQHRHQETAVLTV